MKLKYEIEINKIADQNIGVAIGNDAAVFKNLLFLNGTGKKIIELLNEEISRDRIICLMLQMYEGEETFIANEVNSFLDKLIALGLVDNGNI